MTKFHFAAMGLAALVAAPLAAQTAQAPKPITKANYQKELDGRFASVDGNKDGSLNLAELSAAETRTRQQIEAQLLARRKASFEKADTNKDGNLSFAEFSAATGTPKLNSDGKQTLSKLDTNKDGKVTAAEFKAPMLTVFAKLDTNKDGTVSVEEQKKAAAR
ncbi:EF-hand domain-containing protein [Sphingomonas rhizophila]|uniref:EF-hand domain-containing protein n=1 Tax=Sphingomonas rhizophila TaxID=2071607 RepID=A0A7G9SC86_9SPHN|nr:EF-hand domain-containing protein [Sphingomonas rhizophila]QNN65461.1 EF-hand domain-containing protein [Sphingomonas rhizophila]